MTGDDVRVVADHAWSGRWLGVDEQLARFAPGRHVLRVPGSVVPGLRDHHVHLGLVDATRLASAALGAVDDLGWIPADAVTWREQGIGGCRIRIAGPFLTAVGGYPAGRVWAPDAAVRQLRDVGSAVRAVEELAGLGVDQVKVALHATMPVLTDPQLAAIASTAARFDLPVVVHAEGPGQLARAAAVAPAALAHTPWTEPADDRLLAAMVGRTAWISTLAIHGDGPGSGVAADNVRRFRAAGGEIRYGTDLGNGPGPVGLHPGEVAALLAAGLDQDALLRSLCRADPWPPSAHEPDEPARSAPATVTWTPYAPVQQPSDLPAWLQTLRRRRVADLEGAP